MSFMSVLLVSNKQFAHKTLVQMFDSMLNCSFFQSALKFTQNNKHYTLHNDSFQKCFNP